jgi:integrase
MPRLVAAALTDAQVRALRAGEVPFDVRDGRATGLILTVLPSSRKQWTLRYRTRGKHRRLVLGDYPAVTLSKARELAGRERIRIRDAGDPVAERAAAKAKRTDTVGVLAAEYLEKHARVRKKTGKEDERILNRDVLPYWRERSVRDLTRRDVREIVERVANRGAPIMANRTLEVVRKMLNFGVKRDWLDANPASGIEKPGIEHARERVLDDEEIKALWSLLSRFPAAAEKQAPGRQRADVNGRGEPFCPISPALAAVQKMRLITGQRGGEVVRMRWTDLDLEAGWWTVPAEHSKNGHPHRVPLTNLALRIIGEQPRAGDSAWVFTGREGRLVDARVRKAGAALSRVLGFEFRSHDLRRTAATRMAAAGVPREHISRVLNHVQGGPASARVYDRYSYDAEKRSALERWADRLTAIVEGKTAKVVAMRASSR